MNFQGTVNIKAAQQSVWDFLTDPEKVSQCAPGVNAFEVVEPGKKFRAGVEVGFGSIKAKFLMDVEWTTLDEPNVAALRAQGRAPASAVEARSEMRLSALPDGSTDLNWTADVDIMGTIASLATRLAPTVTRKLSADFFKTVKKKIEK
ncbi:MAG: hypothetical protein DWI61_05840 [Chloroflexi bacterium]|nr:MAG: hypothetical protein DWI61_05840 [Chloroflexota bacterium]